MHVICTPRIIQKFALLEHALFIFDFLEFPPSFSVQFQNKVVKLKDTKWEMTLTFVFTYSTLTNLVHCLPPSPSRFVGIALNLRAIFTSWRRPIRDSAQSTRISVEWRHQYEIIKPKLARNQIGCGRSKFQITWTSLGWKNWTYKRKYKP